MLKQFLYLNDDLVSQFLSQLERGLYEEEEVSRTESQEKKLGGGLGVGPLKGEAGKTTGDEETVSRTLRQTPESRFDRLMELVREQGPVKLVDAVEERTWNDLKRDEIVEIDGRLSTPTMVRMLRAAEGLGDLLPLLQGMGEESVDQEGLQALTAVGSLAKATASKTSVIVAVAGTPEYRFVAEVEANGLRVPVEDLDGEATLVGKVRRRIREGEKHATFEFFAGQSSLPPEVRKEFEDAFEDDEEIGTDIFVTHPAAIVIPIAIYR